jgi:hypothetical protein
MNHWSGLDKGVADRFSISLLRNGIFNFSHLL